MAKRKFSRTDINHEVNQFLVDVNSIGGSHQEGLELILAQYIHTLAESPRKTQVEHLTGLRNMVRELKLDHSA